MFKFYFIFFLLFSLKSLSFDYKKDLAKVSVNSGFIDENRKLYQFPDNINKSKVILILWHHGYGGKEWTIDECWRPDPVILKLNNKKIKDKVIKIYSLCSGVRGLSKDEWNRLYDYWLDNKKLTNELKDKNDQSLTSKLKSVRKLRTLHDKLKEMRSQGFKNIVVAGHSYGGWNGFALMTYKQSYIDAVISMTPAAGGLRENKKKWPWMYDIMYYGWKDLSRLKGIIFHHDKDEFMSPKDYDKLRNAAKNITWVNISNSKCESKKYHWVTNMNCFAIPENVNKIYNYLAKIYN